MIGSRQSPACLCKAPKKKKKKKIQQFFLLIFLRLHKESDHQFTYLPAGEGHKNRGEGLNAWTRQTWLQWRE